MSGWIFGLSKFQTNEQNCMKFGVSSHYVTIKKRDKFGKGAFTYYVSSRRGGREFGLVLILFKIAWAKINNLAYGGGEGV